jgi:hypothetical protein
MRYSKLLASSLLIMSIVSCETQVEKGKELTQQELEYLRARAKVKCVADTKNTFKTYYEATNDRMLDMRRNNAWKYEYKKDNTVVDTSYVFVWKVSPPNVYFRLKLTEAGILTNYFFKVTTDNNMDAVLYIQDQICEKKIDLNYNTSTLNLNIDLARTTEDADTESETDNDYRFTTGFPVFFSSYNKKRVKRIYDKGSSTVKTTETYDYTLTQVSDVSQPAAYNDGTIVNRKYCMMKSVPPVPPATLDVFALPIDVSNCTTSDSAGPDSNGDGVEDFNPATELVF